MTDDEAPADRIVQPRSRAVTALLVASMMAGSVIMGGFGARSAYAERHDPRREKTPEDLERIKRAQLKRERKAAKKASLKSS